MTSTAHPISASHKHTWLALFAWFMSAWTLRGGDGPLLMALMLTCLWAFLTQTKNYKHPSLPNGVAVSIVVWCAVLMTGNLLRAFETFTFIPVDIEAQLKWFSLLMFVPVGWLLYQQQAKLQWLLLLPALIVLFRIVDHSSLETWQSDLFGSGFNGFGLHHVRFGMQASIALIGLLALGPALVQSLSKYRWLAAICLVLTSLIIAQALFRCGSRSGLICLAVGILVLLWRSRSTIFQRLFTRQGAVSSIFVLTLVVTTVVANFDQLHKRFFIGAYQQASYSFSLDEIPRDKDVFLGRRLHLSAFGLDKWQQSPVFGYGPGGARVLLRADPDFHIHPHLHNMYVQALVEIGVSGVLAWLAISISLLIAVLKYGRYTQPPVLNYFWSIAIALAVWSLQSAAIYQASWRFSVVLVCALASAICYMGRQQEKAHSQSLESS